MRSRDWALVAAAAGSAAASPSSTSVARRPWSSSLALRRPASAPTSRSWTSPTRSPAGHQPLADRRRSRCVWLAWVGRARHAIGLVLLGAGPPALAAARCRTRCVALATLGARHRRCSVLVAFLLGDGRASPGRCASFGWLLVVVVLTTPLQSAAEEYLFRGYLSQAIAGVGAAARVPARWSPASSPRPCSPRRTLPADVADVPRPLRLRAGGLGGGLADRRAGGRRSCCTRSTTCWCSCWPGRWGRAWPPRRCPTGVGLLYLLISVASVAAYVAARGAVAAPAAARDAHRGAGPADARRVPVPVAAALTRRPGVGATRSGAVGYRLLRRREVPPMGYGVIGSPTVSGSVSLGSSPGTPARKHRSCDALLCSTARPRRLAAQDAALSRR